jgi:hypothetical protein
MSNSFWESRLRELVASRGDPRTVDTLLRQSAKQIADLDAPKVPVQQTLKPPPWATWNALEKQKQQREDVWNDSDAEQVAWAVMTSSPDEGRCWRIIKARKFYLATREEERVWAQVVEAVKSRAATALRAAWELAQTSLQDFSEVELHEFAAVVRRCQLTLSERKRTFIERHTIG